MLPNQPYLGKVPLILNYGSNENDEIKLPEEAKNDVAGSHSPAHGKDIGMTQGKHSS